MSLWELWGSLMVYGPFQDLTAVPHVSKIEPVMPHQKGQCSCAYMWMWMSWCLVWMWPSQRRGWVGSFTTKLCKRGQSTWKKAPSCLWRICFWSTFSFIWLKTQSLLWWVFTTSVWFGPETWPLHTQNFTSSPSGFSVVNWKDNQKKILTEEISVPVWYFM